MVGRNQARRGILVAAVSTIVLVAACSNDDPPSDELLRIDGPAQVDPSFGGLDGRSTEP